jgi:hypothetical protein
MRTEARYGMVIIAWLAGCGREPIRAVGGSGHVEVGTVQGANVRTDPGDATAVVVAGHDHASGMLVVGAMNAQPESGGFQVKRWQVVIAMLGEPTVGRTYAVAAGAPAGGGSLSYEEFPSEGHYRAWSATGGALRVTSMSGRSATFAFTRLPMGPAGRGTGNEAMGTFELSGTVDVDDLDQVAEQ